MSTDIAVEKAPGDAASFDHSKLKHVETEEKQSLPSQQGLLQWYECWLILLCTGNEVKLNLFCYPYTLKNCKL